MDKKAKIKFNLLLAYTLVSTLALGWLLLRLSGTSGKARKMDELTVKRLNVVGEDGSLRMVISNEDRQHPGRTGGHKQKARKRSAGLLFFNNDGDECGGLLYKVDHRDGADQVSMSLTMDKYLNDQVIQVFNEETHKNGHAEVFRGYRINAYPEGTTLAANLAKLEALKKIKDPKERAEKMKHFRQSAVERTRLFLGQDPQQRDGLFLFDQQGRPRMQIYIDEQGQPRFEVIDKNGSVKALLKQLG